MRNHDPNKLVHGRELIDFHDVGRSIPWDKWHVNLIEGFVLTQFVSLPFGIWEAIQAHNIKMGAHGGYTNKMLTVVDMEFDNGLKRITCACSYDGNYSYVCVFERQPEAR